MNPHQKDEVHPPYSRVFVVCNRDIKEDDLRQPFEEHGEIEDLYMPKDHNTGGHKGIAYIKYRKTSSAAAAIQVMHGARVGPANKHIKVMLASNNRHDKIDNADTDKFKRLFIKVPKQATEEDIKKEFSKVAEVESVRIQKDRSTNESKGLAYVQFTSFLNAAIAYEECDRKYRPVFATPRQDLKRTRDSYDNFDESFHSNSSFSYKDSYNNHYHGDQMQSLLPMPMPQKNVKSLMKPNNQGYTSVSVVCSPIVLQKHLEALFNIIPGFVQCQYWVDMKKDNCKATICYDDGISAAHAVERLNNFEFPSGEVLSVTPHNDLSKAANDLASIVNGFKNAAESGSPDLVQLADAIAQASMLIKAATHEKAVVNDSGSRQLMGFCNVPLPPTQPIVYGRVAQRCFIVCKPQPPPDNVLRDVFCRFGDLIDISTFPNKTFGFAKYASVRAAEDAINTLHKATVYGTFLKVMKADERPSKNGDTDTDSLECKRMRLEAEDIQ